MHCRSFSKVEFLDIIGTKSLKSFPPCYSQSTLITDPPPPLPSKNGLKLVCNVNIVYGKLKSDNSNDYTQKPQRNCTFMNSALGEKRRAKFQEIWKCNNSGEKKVLFTLLTLQRFWICKFEK